MAGITQKTEIRVLLSAVGTGILTAVSAMAQSDSEITVFHSDRHISFDRPEAWGLKYFTSISLPAALQPPQSPSEYRTGTVAVGFELDWIPTLDAGQRRIGFNGTSPEDLNKAPVFPRLAVRVGLPGKFSAFAAAPPPFRVFGVTAHLLAFGVERPLWEREQWTLRWRGYGQVGSIKGAFTCPRSVLPFAPGSPQNPTACVGESADVASLRYAGSEFQFAYRMRRLPKLVPHVSAGGNFIDGVFQLHAPVEGGLDETRLWTHGGTFFTTGGASYSVTPKVTFTVDVFYSPLWVRRTATAPITNDGLFNVRAFVNYTFHRGPR
jgi:hypothetical protein